MWDERYAADEFVYGTEPNDFLKANTDQLKPGRVLCLADGEGRNSVYLATLGFEVTAVDLSAVGLEKARRFAAENGVKITTIHADLNDFVITPNHWDNIVSIFCNFPAPLREKVHSAAKNGLSEGGAFLLEAYTVRQLDMPGDGGPPVPEMMYSEEVLRQDFQSLDLLHLQEIDREIHEGILHRGLSAVVQLIARVRR
jgi:SAM-dependent methyltransferase